MKTVLVAGRRYSDSFANHVSDHRVELSNYKLCKKAIASVLHCSLNFLYRDNNNKQKTIKKIEQIMAVVSLYIYNRMGFTLISKFSPVAKNNAYRNYVLNTRTKLDVGETSLNRKIRKVKIIEKYEYFSHIFMVWISFFSGVF